MDKPSYISLTQFFKGDASQEVIDEVTSWQSVNQEEFNELQSIWKEYGSLAASYQPDLGSAWSKIDERTKSSSNVWIFRIAAIIVLGIGIGWMTQLDWFSQGASIETYYSLGENRIIELKDGTIVTLAPGSILTLDEEFGSDNRDILLEGKGFFEVFRNESLPLNVRVGEMKVSVLGTDFEIEQHLQLIEVVVTEGAVAVEVSTSKIELVENEKAVFDPVKATLIKSYEIDENHLAWKSLVLSFTNSTLENFASDLEAFYNAKIEIDAEHKDRRITAEFNNQSLAEVFEVVQATLDVKIDTLNSSHFRIE